MSACLPLNSTTISRYKNQNLPFCHKPSAALPILLENIANPPDEMFLHLFLNCPTVQAWHGEFVRRYLNDINLNPVESTKLWFLGITPGTDSPSFAVLSAILLFQYCIWEEKLRKRKPAFRTINLLFEEILSASFSKNKIFNKSAATLPYAIFRPFRVHYGPMQ